MNEQELIKKLRNRKQWKTAHEELNEPNDVLGKHKVCPICLRCEECDKKMMEDHLELLKLIHKLLKT
jgi:hypothetical protein